MSERYQIVKSDALIVVGIRDIETGKIVAWTSSEAGAREWIDAMPTALDLAISRAFAERNQ